MNFTYKIENYIPSEKRLFVVYQPTDNTLPPYGGWVGLDADMTEAEIKERIVECVPIDKWDRTPDPIVEDLVGTTDSFTYIAPTITPQQIEQSDAVRSIRNMKLNLSDWTQLPDAPLTTEQKTQWETYRQALRDVTEQEGFPSTIVWPTAPNN
jgi:hypothetical protein